MSLILGIETSCDETSAAVVSNGRAALSNVIDSQISIHREYGGVVPEIAGRRHIERIEAAVSRALSDAGVSLGDIDAIAACNGPGLVGALLTGLSFAKALAFSTAKPLISVHHIEGHICANYIEHEGLEPPLLSLVASGGHSDLILAESYADYKLIGKTRDDAAGEAFDKAARALGLPYPGGVEIDRLARKGDPSAIAFPRAMSGDGLDMSFSGLKSAVLNYLNKAGMTGEKINAADAAASFQEAVVATLTEKSLAAIKATGAKRFALAGGVAANSLLRERLAKACQGAGVSFFVPSPVLCTDNAAMIASRAFFDYERGVFADLTLNAKPSMTINNMQVM